MPSNVSGSIDPRVALPVQQRPDLTFAPRLTRHGRWWTVKDPLSLQYFQLRDEELFVLKRLDGRTSAAAILRDFRRQFAPLKIGMQELTAFVLSLAERGLVTVGHRGLSHRLDDRRQAGKRRRRWTPFANPLAIRFRGIDPQAMLDRLYPAVRWMFSRTAMIVYLLTIASALMLIFARWDEFQMRIPATSSLFATRNLLAFAAAVGLIKILHELGHAFACRHFGGECRELGVMLLAFVPCLYCNVSDTWLLSNRWHRIAVSAAGIGVELVLAAICTFLWWYSEPGLLHSLCFSVMFVASAGTLLINGNPLLRYDGYHILTDLLDTPNLRQRASAASRRYSARWLFGVHEPDGPFLTRRWRGRLALFGVASSIYLWVVLFVILRFLDQGLEPYGLRPLVVLLALLVVGSRLAGGSASAAQRVRGWHAAGLIRPIRFGLGLLFVGGLAGAAVLLPLPHRIAAPCVVAVRDPRPVYVTVPGRLTPAAHAAAPRYGDVLADGEVIARLNNYDVERDVVRLEGECHQRRSLLTALRRSQKSDAVTAAQLRAAEAELRDFEGRLAQRREDRESLTLTSPGGGVLLPPADAATRQKRSSQTRRRTAGRCERRSVLRDGHGDRRRRDSGTIRRSFGRRRNRHSACPPRPDRSAATPATAG